MEQNREYREFESRNGQYRATWQTWYDANGNQKTKFEWVDKDYGEGYYLNDIPWTVAYAIIRMGKMKEIGEDDE